MDKNLENLHDVNSTQEDLDTFNGQVASWRLEKLVEKIKGEQNYYKYNYSIKSSC